jgi:hypothetical protein
MSARENYVSCTAGNHPFAQSVGDVAAADNEIGLLVVELPIHCNRMYRNLHSIINCPANDSGWSMGGTISDIVRAQNFVDWRLVCHGEI